MRRSLLLLSAALAACGPVQEKEPNDDFAHATAVPAGRYAKGTLSSASDADWYRVQAPRDGILSAHLGGIRDVDWVLSVHAADRSEIRRVDETALGGDEEALDVWLPRGDAFVVVSNKNANARSFGQPYRLDLKFESEAGREREPNDRAVSATAIEPGSTVRGHYHPATNPLLEGEQLEEDWFRIRVDRPGLHLLNVDVSEVPRIDAVLEVYDTNAYKIREADSGGAGEPESLRSFGVRGPAEYRLRLRSKARAANAEVFYQLVTELVPYQGRVEFEPNDQRLEATPIEVDAVTGTISPAGDADWYKIATATDSRKLLRVELSALEGMDLQLAVMNEVGNPVVVVDNMGKEQPEVLTGLGARSEQYLVVSEKSGRKGDARKTYTLSRSLTPWQPGLEYELNDSSRTAQEIKIGESVDGYFAPKGDVDWYEFNVYQKGPVVLEVSGVLNVRASASLYDQEFRPLRSVQAAKAGDSLSVDAELEPGTYAVKLEPAEPGQNNVRDKYTVRVRSR